MLPPKLRKAVYAFVAAQGLFTALAPRLASRLGLRMGLFGFENTQELEAEDWYLRAVRATGVGMLAAGGTALLLESRAEKRAESDEPLAADEAIEDGENGASDPVEVDL